MPDFDPSNEPLIQAIMQGNPADALLKHNTQRPEEWYNRLDFDDYEEATYFSMSINKSKENPKYSAEMVGKVMVYALSRCSVKAKRANLFANVISGTMAMAIRAKDNNGDTRDKR